MRPPAWICTAGHPLVMTPVLTMPPVQLRIQHPLTCPHHMHGMQVLQISRSTVTGFSAVRMHYCMNMGWEFRQMTQQHRIASVARFSR